MRFVHVQRLNPRLEQVKGVRSNIKGTTLVWTDPRGTTHDLRPTITDTFAVPDMGWTIRLTRDAAGTVTGFGVSIARARHVMFDRQAE